MSSIPLPALAVRPPESPLEQYQRVQSLVAQKQLMQQRQQLMPLQLQQEQQATQAGGIDLQMKHLALKNTQVAQGVLSDPNFQSDFSGWKKDRGISDATSGATPAGTPSAGAPGSQGAGASAVPLHPLAQYLAEKRGLSMFGPGGALEISNALTGATQKIADLAKTQVGTQTSALENHSKQLDNFDDLVEPVLAEKDPTKQAQGVQKVQSEISAHPDLYPTEATQNLGALNTIQGLQVASNHSKIRQMLIEDATKQAGLTKATQEADVVAQLAKPEALAAPGAQAAIQAKISDPTTNPADVPRLQALLPKATIAQQQQVRQKAREAAATQAVAQGDPNAAGQLLANRTLTIDEMKVRGLTPQFQQQAIAAAQKIDPNFKAPEASAQGKIAASPAYSQFFGNTDSLLVKGGTLDQLEARGAALGNTKIPAYNSLANWTKAALGQGPQAAYAASVLGVADDYSKVMTGGTGSDTSRQQALDIIGKNLSPEGRAAAVQQIREQVMSQREGRVGSNPYLRDMYPAPQGAQRATGASKFQVGQSVTIKGKQMTITSVHPDGSFDAK